MKIRILDRILVALAGLLMLAAGAALAAQLFFRQDVAGWINGLLSDEKLRVFLIIGGAVLCLLGVYCLLMLFRHRGKNGKFITQKTESGELSISLKALETMVLKCLEPHKEITPQGVQLENQKGGLLIRIRGTVAGGVSIPLTVDTLQQQIKQYVTACSGVEVKEIRVQIESSGEDAKDAPFAIAAPAAPALLKGAAEAAAEGENLPGDAAPADNAKLETEPAAPEAEKTPAEDSAAAAAAAAAALMDEVPPEEDDRPVHQRLFSTMEEPCVMPMPPTAKEAEEDARTEESIRAAEAVSPEESVRAAEDVPPKEDAEPGETAETKENGKTADSADEPAAETDGETGTRPDEAETIVKDVWTEGSND